VKIDLSNPAWRQTLPPARTVAADAPVAACAFSRDGATVAFALGDGCVRHVLSDWDLDHPPLRAEVLRLSVTGLARLSLDEALK